MERRLEDEIRAMEDAMEQTRLHLQNLPSKSGRRPQIPDGSSAVRLRHPLTVSGGVTGEESLFLGADCHLESGGDTARINCYPAEPLVPAAAAVREPPPCGIMPGPPYTGVARTAWE